MVDNERAKTTLLREIDVTDFSQIKKGDLFFSSNSKGNLYKATQDGKNLPDTKELGTIECVLVGNTECNFDEIIKNSLTKPEVAKINRDNRNEKYS